MLVLADGGMASSSGSNINNQVTSGRVSRNSRKKIDSYANPVLVTERHSIAFNDWPEDEKEALLRGMKKYGHYDLDSLARAVPGKSRENIKMVINLWWKSARSAMSSSSSGTRKVQENVTRKGRPSNKPTPIDKVPIEQWLYKLENSPAAAGGFTHTKLLARAFLYISKYEPHPSPIDCNGVDFKALYEFLHAMLNGFPAKDLNPQTSAYLLNSLKEMAANIQERGNSEQIHFLERCQRITGSIKEVRQYGGKRKRPTESVAQPDPDEVKFRKLLEVPGFNPLNVNIELLKK